MSTQSTIRSRRTAPPLISGRLTYHPAGYGILVPDKSDWTRRTIVIPRQQLHSAKPGDQVLIRLRHPSRKSLGTTSRRVEGEVVRISRHSHDESIGKVFHFEGAAYVAPLEDRYPFAMRLVDTIGREIPDGTIVAVSVREHALRGETPDCVLVEVLGDPADPETPYNVVCRKYNLSKTFPEDVLQEAEEVQEVGAEEMQGRQDLRNLLTVTIDGPTARDFDDAVSIEKRGRQYRLWVHIADVAHYVRPGTALDREARVRSTSVYFPDRAIPMLPPRLSTDLCSLRPATDRFALTARMDLDGRGHVLHVEYFESVIRSDQRFTYDQVDAMLRGDAALQSRFQNFLCALQWMRELCAILRRRRLERGALDFDLPHAVVEYDANGQVVDIVREKRNDAHRIIEEFMLVTNATVARTLKQRKLPLLYRVHEPPDPAKIAQFLTVASRFGFRLRPRKDGRYRPKDFNRWFHQMEGNPEATILANWLLRSFPKAYYAEVDRGHFGLAISPYTHFTSPIRRYPDLVVHRLVKAACARRPVALRRLVRQLPTIARQANEREQNADEAQREILRGIMARFMANRVGTIFDAFIIGIKHNGVFVELVDHAVEGFVAICTLSDDYYVFHPEGQCLIGEDTGRVFRLGDQVRVRVGKVEPHRHLIGFSIVQQSRSN